MMILEVSSNGGYKHHIFSLTLESYVLYYIVFSYELNKIDQNVHGWRHQFIVMNPISSFD